METLRLTETVEDYLQLIYTMKREGAPVIAARVKERKGVSAPTAWATLKRMERDGLVELSSSHHIELSPKGLEMAESIIRRHMLAERLLTDILKLDWADVHDEAHKMEHAISPLIERQILKLLDSPETCPHGNPIPGLWIESTAPKTRALLECAEGTTVVVNNIAEHAEDDAELMQYLQRSSLVPGKRLHIDEVALSNGTITVTIVDEDRNVAVGVATAELIMVREEN